MNHVDLSVTAGIAVITLSRPDRANSIELATAHDLRKSVREATTRDDVKAIVLLGQGRHFCAGGDVEAMAREDSTWAGEVAGAVHDAILALHVSAKVVIAGVQGAVAGAGMSLVLASDLVIATPQTRFVAAWNKIGLTPDGGASWLLPRAIGSHRAAAMLIGNRELKGAEALAWGLVTELADETELRGRALEVGQEIAQGAWRAAGTTRALLRNSWDATLATQLDEERECIARSRRGNQSALDDFFARRSGRSDVRVADRP